MTTQELLDKQQQLTDEVQTTFRAVFFRLLDPQTLEISPEDMARYMAELASINTRKGLNLGLKYLDEASNGKS